MKNENIEEILKKLGTENVPEDIQIIAKETSDKFSKELANSQKQNKHLVLHIFKSKNIFRFAAAAVIIIGVLFISHFFNDSISITTPAFSKIIENALSQKWVYMFEEDRKDGQIVAEYWYNPSQKKLYLKSSNDAALVLDMTSGDEYEYRDGQITIRKRDEIEVYYDWIAERMPMLSNLLDRYQRQGALIQQKDSIYNSKPAWLYEIQLTLPDRGDTQTHSYSWLVDKKTHLPIICEHTEIYGSKFNEEYNENISRSERYAFDYPDSGPEDIYALGVPSDANIIDKRVNIDTEIQKLSDKINNIKESKYNSYAYIAREGDYLRKRVVKDSSKIREELLELKINSSDYLPKKEQYFQAMGDTFDSIDKWIDESGIEQRQIISFCNENFDYGTSERGIEQKNPMEISLRSGVARERYNSDFLNYCWRYATGDSIIKNAYSEENNLICTETSNTRYYFDPAKEYMCVRSETKEGEITYEIEEFKNTASGMLYPSKIRERHLIGSAYSDERTVRYVTIYIYAKDVDDDLRARLDPKALPNFVDPGILTMEYASRHAQEDSNDIEYTGFTPLHMAIYRQDIERIKTLLKKGAEVEPSYDTGATPMELAVASGNIEIVKLLYNHGADFISNDKEQRDALGLAVKEGYKEIAEFMLSHGSNVDNNYKNLDKPLKYAASKGDLDMVKMLLAYNPEIDAKDTEGRTPLYDAITSLRNEVAHRAIVDEKIVQKYEDVISLLIEHGADINMRDNQKYTPLLITITSFSASSKTNEQQLDFLRFLLKNGADPNLSSDSDSTVHRAMESRMYDVVRILLESGADPWQQITESLRFQDYHNLLYYARLIKDDKMYDILYPYMKERYEQTNKELVELTKQVITACIENDEMTIEVTCVDNPKYYQSWKGWSQEIKDFYEGHDELLEEVVPGWFTDDGFAQTYIPLPEGSEKKSILLGFIQYPNGKWRCIYYGDQNYMPEFEQPVNFVYDLKFGLQEFRNFMYENAGMTEKVTKGGSGASTLHGKFAGQVIVTIQEGNLKIDFEEENWRKRYFILTSDSIKFYQGNTLRFYTSEYVQKQNEYPEQLIYHPSEMIIDTGDLRYNFTMSDGQVLLTQGENKTKAERFVFDLVTWQLQK